MQDKNSEIIDIGCGTGLSGQEITLKGFNNIDGSDFSKKMLEEAKLKNIYRSLFTLDLNKNYFKLDKNYDAIVAAGVISPNHAKPECLKNCLNYLKPKGVITAQVGSQDKKPHQVENWLNVFHHHFGNTKLSRVYVPSFDCSWNFSSSINH